MNNENHYLLLIHGGDFSTIQTTNEMEATLGRFQAWFGGLREKGIFVSANGLDPALKFISGKGGRVVADGPYAESKEAIGGYVVISASSLDEAIAIAKDSPVLDFGARIELRSVAEDCPLTRRARELKAEPALASV